MRRENRFVSTLVNPSLSKIFYAKDYYSWQDYSFVNSQANKIDISVVEVDKTKKTEDIYCVELY